MNNRTPHPAQEAAAMALEKARIECTIAGLNPDPFADQLTEFVIVEVKKALAEMAEHQAHGGPSAIIMLTQPIFQAVYIKDAGRRAANSLLEKLNFFKGGNQLH